MSILSSFIFGVAGLMRKLEKRGFSFIWIGQTDLEDAIANGASCVSVGKCVNRGPILINGRAGLAYRVRLYTKNKGNSFVKCKLYGPVFNETTNELTTDVLLAEWSTLHSTNANFFKKYKLSWDELSSKLSKVSDIMDNLEKR